MIEVYKLTKRHLDGARSGDSKLDQIKIFSTNIGHGIGTIDFSEKVLVIDENEYAQILQQGGEYLKFKIGNLSQYSEIEVFPEHAIKLVPQMMDCPLREILMGLNEGYLVLRKDFKNT